MLLTPLVVWWLSHLEAPASFVADRWFRVRFPAGGFHRAEVLRLVDSTRRSCVLLWRLVDSSLGASPFSASLLIGGTRLIGSLWNPKRFPRSGFEDNKHNHKVKDAFLTAKQEKKPGYTKILNIIINRAVSRDCGYKGKIDARVTTWKKTMSKSEVTFNEHATRAVTLTEIEGIVNEAMCGRISTIFFCVRLFFQSASLEKHKKQNIPGCQSWSGAKGDRPRGYFGKSLQAWPPLVPLAQREGREPQGERLCRTRDVVE